MFSRPTPEQHAERRKMQREANLQALCMPAKGLHRGSYSGSTAGPAPKGEKAKPGKRAPNVEERAWMDWITSQGCIACRLDGLGFVAPAVHHILRGGVRMGHLWTLPLCPGHHQDGYGAPGMVARHPYKPRFENRYGQEGVLLARLRAEYRRT